MPKPRELIEQAREALPALPSIRIETATQSPLVRNLIAGGCIVAVLALTFYAGKRVERSWWRTEIAAKSAAAKTVMTQLGREAPDLDARLTAALGDDLARLSDAERKLADLSKPRPAQAPSAPALPVDRCTLPADCLR